MGVSVGFNNSTHPWSLNNNKIIHWFAQNCTIKHSKITMIPIGLDYHTVLNKDFWWSNKLTPLQQEAELIKVKNSTKPLMYRQIKCYSNFHFIDYKIITGNSQELILAMRKKRLAFAKFSFMMAAVALILVDKPSPSSILFMIFG